MWFKKERVYADAAAATPLSPAARRELLRLLPLYGNPSALHHEAVEAKKELERARTSVAESIGAHPDEIVFTASATQANQLAVQIGFQKGSALTSAVEHPSVLQPLRRRGLPVVELPVDHQGLVEVKKLEERITEDTSFVSIQLVNSEVGAIQPVRDVAKILRHYKGRSFATTKDRPLHIHTDASQAPLWMDIKVERLGVDLLTLDGQKIGGPKGVGCLYIKRGLLIEPVLEDLQSGTENVAQAGSFAVALAEAQAGVAERVSKILQVRNYLLEEIQRLVPGAVLNGPGLKGEYRVANNINVSIPGLNADMAVLAMDAQGIAISTRSACTTNDEEPSHVIKALGVVPELAGTAIRITLLPGATVPQARRIAQTLAEIAKRYKQ